MQDRQNGAAAQPKNLVLECGAFVLPHPDKVAKGGEDWYFLAPSKRAIGIADGVGSWVEVNVDPAIFARQLMSNACEAAEAQITASSSASDPPSNGAAVSGDLLAQDILEAACSKTTVLGSSTACVIVMNGNVLTASNIGDSGFLVVRDGAALMATTQQQHKFNFPFQVGGLGALGDSPAVSDRYEVEVKPGDIIILGTDGLWDNVFHDELVSVLKYCTTQKMGPGKMAQVVALYAQHRAADTQFASPFAYSAYQAGIRLMGGKMDDITIVAGVVEQEPTESPPRGEESIPPVVAAATAGSGSASTPISKL